MWASFPDVLNLPVIGRMIWKCCFYSNRKAPSLGFGSGSSCSRRTCQRMRCASWVRVRILWASCYVINTQPRGFGIRFVNRQEGNFMSFGCFICASSPRFIQYTHTSLLLINKCNPESRWLSMVSLNTLNSWNSSSRTDKIVYTYWSNIGLAAAVDSKFDWEKLWNHWQQFPWTKKAVSRTAALLFDNNNACILKQNTNTARLCRFVFKGFKSGSGTTRLQDELDL